MLDERSYRVQNVLAAIENQQHVPRSQGFQNAGVRIVGSHLKPDGNGNGRGDLVGLPYAAHIYEPHRCRKLCQDRVAQGDSNRGFAHTAWPDNCYEAFGEKLGTDVANSIVSPNHPGERRWNVVRQFHMSDIDIGFCDQTSGAHSGNRCYKAISPPRNVDEILDVRLTTSEGLAQRRHVEPKASFVDDQT